MNATSLLLDKRKILRNGSRYLRCDGGVAPHQSTETGLPRRAWHQALKRARAQLSRVMNRIKALYRSWAIPCSGTTVYAPRHRGEWLAKIVEPGVRVRAEHLYQQLDNLQPIRIEARRELLRESHKHAAVKLLRQIW